MLRKTHFHLIAAVTVFTANQTMASDWLKQLDKLSDKSFIGALSAPDVALANSIAKQIDSQLPGQARRCGEPNLLTGTLTGNLYSSKLSSPEPLLANADAALLPLLTRLDKSSHRQDAVILYSLSLIGPKAESAAPYLDWFFSRDEPWAATALDAITCDKHQAPRLADFAEKLPTDFTTGFKACSAEFLPQVLSYAVKPDQLWPNNVFDETVTSSMSGCGDQQAPSSLPSELMPSIVHFLLNTDVSNSRKLEVMDIMAEKFIQHVSALTPALQQLLKDKSEDIRAAAERLTVMLGTEQSALIWRQWLIDGYSSYSWQYFLPYVSKHRSVVMPALLKQLESPYWSERTAATEAIASLGAGEAIPSLSAAVADHDWVQAEAIVETLKPYIATNAQAAATVKMLAESYWSPRVRQKAAKALVSKPGDTVDNDEEMHRIEIIGIADVEHGLLTCVRDKTPQYEFPDGEKRTIHWIEPTRKPLPRGEFSDVSSWCGMIGDFVVHELEDGWLAGCLGFESSGSLAFLPKDRNKPIQTIAHISTTSIVEFKEALYVTGRGWFTSGKEDAGQLFRIKRHGNEWQIEPYMLLPSLTQAAAVIDGYMVFDDAHSTVAV